MLAVHNGVHNAYRAGISLSKVSGVMVSDSAITNYSGPRAPCYEVDEAKKYEIVGGSCSVMNEIKAAIGSDDKEHGTKERAELGELWFFSVEV